MVRKLVHGTMGHQVDPIDPLSYFSFQDCCNKSHGMSYVRCGVVHIKDLLQ